MVTLVSVMMYYEVLSMCTSWSSFDNGAVIECEFKNFFPLNLLQLKIIIKTRQEAQGHMSLVLLIK